MAKSSVNKNVITLGHVAVSKRDGIGINILNVGVTNVKRLFGFPNQDINLVGENIVLLNVIGNQ